MKVHENVVYLIADRIYHYRDVSLEHILPPQAVTLFVYIP